MGFDILGDLNWLAVIVAAVAYFALGAIWYAQAVFGKIWMESSGVQIDPDESPSAAFYVGPLVTCLVATIATAMLAEATGAETFGDAVVLALVVAIGYVATVTALGVAFDETKPKKGPFFAVVAGYHLVGLLIAATIVTLWT